MGKPSALDKRVSAEDARAPSDLMAGLDIPSHPIASETPEKFIQVDRSDIIRQTLDKLFEPGQRPLAKEVLHYICILRQHESAEALDSLIELYDPFNPDDETVNLTEISGAQRRTQLETLKSSVIDLVDSANYIAIEETALKAIFDNESHGGFSAEVELAEYDFHLLYYRGAIRCKIPVKSWRRLWLFEEQGEVDGYRRLFIGLKLKPFESRVAELMKDGMKRRKAERIVRKIRRNQMLEGVSENTLHLKVFRRIPQTDLRILFPNAKIRFTLFDRLWLWLGSGGSTIFAIVMAVLKFVAAVAISLFFVVITIGGAIGAIFRAVTNFFNTRTRYMAKLAKSLYFHSIGSNQSVLTLLTDEAEEEDLKEAILTYALLLRHGHHGLDAVKYEAERFLKDEFDVDCSFDIEDGCVHLRGLGLLVEDEDGNPRIRELDDAREHLAAKWIAIPAAA